MAKIRQTPLHGTHVAEGAEMVDFGGWDMPMQYPDGIIAEHLYTRSHAGIFDVSHMGRFIIKGPDRLKFLQHVLTSNVAALDINQAQYTIIPTETGGAVDDAYVYLFEEGWYLLVVNAANTKKDWDHLSAIIRDYDCSMTDITDQWSSIALQGPDSKKILMVLTGGVQPTEPVKNALGSLTLEGREAHIAKTGYTGEPLGFEIYVKSSDAVWLWNRLIELGAHPAGLGARDTLRLEAAYPLYGDEFGTDHEGKEIPIYAVPLAKFAVSFSELKGDFIGREALAKQFEEYKKIQNRDFSNLTVLPKRITPITLTGRGVMRSGMEVYRGDEKIGWVTSGTMVPYYKTEGTGLLTNILEDVGKRAIGLAYLNSDVLVDDAVEVDIRGKRVKAAIPEYHMRVDAPPFARPILYGYEEEGLQDDGSALEAKGITLLKEALDNHEWRQKRCVNLIPSENTPSEAVRLLSSLDPSGRYAEHKKIKPFYDADVFYYQGTKFIDDVEQRLVEEMKKYLGCSEVETRVTSGQMANTAVFSALMDWKNRLDRRQTPKRLGPVMNNHIIRGGHLSAQPMGALHDFIAVDPVTERPYVVNFPVCQDNPYKIDVEETKKLIEQYKPELIIFGKSMVLYREPVAEIRQFLTDANIHATIMYDMAHVLGLVGPHFQEPFKDGADIVTGSTHKTFFGPQRGVIGVNWKEEDLEYGLWETIERRAFPGSVSNHHLGTMLGLLMATYEMNAFKDEYQSAVVANAKSFAKSLASNGLDVIGDPSMGYTETHQVLLSVGYAAGPEIAERLEQNNIIVNYQATPDEEGFTASGALRMGVSEMTRFGFGPDDFEKLAELMAACILNGTNVSKDVEALRAQHLEMQYCFKGEAFEKQLAAAAKVLEL